MAAAHKCPDEGDLCLPNLPSCRTRPGLCSKRSWFGTQLAGPAVAEGCCIASLPAAACIHTAAVLFRFCRVCSYKPPGLDSESMADGGGAEPTPAAVNALPAKHALAKKWDENAVVRAQVRETNKLLLWPSPQQTGVISKASLRTNRHVILAVIDVWSSCCATPRAPIIPWLRDEVF